MAHIQSEICDIPFNGVSELMDLLLIDVETDVVDDKPGREDALCSVSKFWQCSF